MPPVLSPASRLGIPDHVPVDLVVDFDYRADPRFTSDPQGGLVQLTRHPPLFYTPHYGGHWVAHTAAAIRAIFGDPIRFTSAISTIPATMDSRDFKLIPENLDPPNHARYRDLLNPYFSPKSVAGLEGKIRPAVVDLIERLQPKGEADFVSEMAAVMPVEVFMRYMGFPTERRDEFVEWMVTLFTSADPDKRAVVFGQMHEFINQIIAERRARPADDIVSKIIAETIDNRPIDDEELFAIFLTLFLAGLETVNTALTFMMRGLAEDADLQRQIRAKPTRISIAVAEMMRRYGIVNLRRTVVTDTEVLGVQLKAGDAIWCPTAAPGMDPQANVDPLTINFDRRDIQHTAFGFGIHRCLGQHLANLEMRIFFEEWFKRMPDVRLKRNSTVRTNSGAGFTCLTLPLEWNVR